MTILEASYHILSNHQHRLNLAFSYVQLLSYHNQVNLELLRSVNENRVGTLQELLKNWTESQQKDGRFSNTIVRLY